MQTCLAPFRTVHRKLCMSVLFSSHIIAQLGGLPPAIACCCLQLVISTEHLFRLLPAINTTATILSKIILSYYYYYRYCFQFCRKKNKK
ncbi:hypothetical protein J3E68DRAFT_392600 [Trichoderma sp. SZMC 28012]